jgi:hypothetical protein
MRGSEEKPRLSRTSDEEEERRRSTSTVDDDAGGATGTDEEEGHCGASPGEERRRSRRADVARRPSTTPDDRRGGPRRIEGARGGARVPADSQGQLTAVIRRLLYYYNLSCTCTPHVCRMRPNCLAVERTTVRMPLSD